MISIINIRKNYKLYNNPIDRLKETFSLSKKLYHKNFYALNNISLNIEKGEIVGVIGNNGSGKSTLLKIITNVLTPSSGTVKVNGKITALLELGTGFNPELSGIENLKLLLKINNIRDIESKIIEIIKFADIGEFLYQPVKTYSSGMKSRLAFAFSISTDPEILIIDEVLSVGDAAFQRKCFAKIEQFKDEEKTILFVSHSIGQIIQLCTRVIWLNNGNLILDGDTKIIAGLYQKYGESKDLNISQIKDEYLSLLNKPKEIKNKTTNSSYSNKIKSKSIIFYKENGAKILDFFVLNKNNEKVNVLQKNEKYYFVYEFIIFNDLENLNMVMSIRTKSGLQISGLTTPILKNLEINIKYKVKWEFTAILNPNNYFFNCALNSINYGEKTIHHRVVDAYMIEVVDNNKTQSHGLIDIVKMKEISAQ